jgi:hypothetical protein
LKFFLQKSLTTFTTFKKSCKTKCSGKVTRTKKLQKVTEKVTKCNRTRKNLEKPGISRPGGGHDITNSYTRKPPAATQAVFLAF